MVPEKFERKKLMKNLKQILGAAAIIIGISMTASAQDNGKKVPPKPSPPVIVVPPPKNPPKDEKPKSDDKRKKPDAYVFNIQEQ